MRHNGAGHGNANAPTTVEAVLTTGPQRKMANAKAREVGGIAENETRLKRRHPKFRKARDVPMAPPNIR